MSKTDKKAGNDFRNHLDFDPTCVLEAGVGRVNQCLSRPFWDTADCLLFEPLPHFFFDLAVAAAHHPKVRIYPVALWDHENGVQFYEYAQSSWVEGVSPRSGKKRGNLAKARTTSPSARLSLYDTGQIDLALIDVEAAELHVIQHMVSRPRLMALEMWRLNKPDWCHDDYEAIMAWMRDNDYTEIARSKRDSFFKRNDS